MRKKIPLVLVCFAAINNRKAIGRAFAQYLIKLKAVNVNKLLISGYAASLSTHLF